MLKKLIRKSVMPFLAFALALIIGGIVIGLTDSRVNSKISDPIEFIKALLSTVGNAYLSLFQGAIYDPNLAEGEGFIRGFYPFSETLLAASPLILCGLSVAVAFKAGLFNIGAQGQFIFGAIGASFIGFRYDLPVGIHILAAIAFAIILAGIWGGIVGFLKAKTGAHEVIVTIMLNYIAARFILWILGEPAFLRPGRIDPLAPPVKETSRLPLLFGENYRVNVGLIVALAVAALVYFILNRTTLGFRFRAVGANATAARTAGISVGATTIAAMILAGALAGVGGAVHVLGNQYELTTDIAGSFGFDAITVALLGRGSPIGVVLASILFAALRVGGVTMQANVQVPVEIVLVIQALVVLFIAAPGLVAKIFRVRKYEKAETLASKGWNG
jgi:general nucleoside transport system permease protein